MTSSLYINQHCLSRETFVNKGCRNVMIGVSLSQSLIISHALLPIFRCACHCEANAYKVEPGFSIRVALLLNSQRSCSPVSSPFGK